MIKLKIHTNTYNETNVFPIKKKEEKKYHENDVYKVNELSY